MQFIIVVKDTDLNHRCSSYVLCILFVAVNFTLFASERDNVFGFYNGLKDSILAGRQALVYVVGNWEDSVFVLGR